MISFESDYIAGCHPEVLKALTETNMQIMSGYGNDPYTKSAAKKIIEACKCPKAQVYFAVGGTQTNSLVISTMLKMYEGVVAAHTGHIATHEAGAIEYSGHKVLEINGKNGKIIPEELQQFMKDFHADGNKEHEVWPGMVYISHPTEYGTLYTKQELKDISRICHANKIPLFLDGARLGYGLKAYDTDVTLAEIAKLCDVFYIGGTKVGALCGEAIVFTKENMPDHFENLCKKRGALPAKGRLVSVQFDALFTNDLYFKISRHAIDMAEKLKAVFKNKKYKFLCETPTNQQFIILENTAMKELAKKVKFAFWEKVDEEHTAVRFATSWSTTDEDLKQLEKYL